MTRFLSHGGYVITHGTTFWAILAVLAALECFGFVLAVGLCRMAARGDYGASERRSERP